MTLETKLAHIRKSIGELRAKADLRERVVEKRKNIISRKNTLTNIGIKYEDIKDLRTIPGEVSSLERDYNKIRVHIEKFKNLDPVLRKLDLFKDFFIGKTYQELEDKTRKEAERGKHWQRDIERDIDRAVDFYHKGVKALDELHKLINSFDDRSMKEETYFGLLNDIYRPDLFGPVYDKIKEWFKEKPKEAELFGGPRVYEP